MLKETPSLTFESNHRRKDGSMFPVEVNVSLSQLDGQLAIMGVARNMSKRKCIQNCLAFLAQTATTPSGENFFLRLARYLAEVLEMDFV